MPNEFENEVRKKLAELNFVPSAPVWDKIEEQIRKKKERRRGLIWFPLLGLLLAGGIWFTQATKENRLHDESYAARKVVRGSQDEKSNLKYEDREKSGVKAEEKGLALSGIPDENRKSGVNPVAAKKQETGNDPAVEKIGNKGAFIPNTRGENLEIKTVGSIGKRAPSKSSGKNLPAKSGVTVTDKNQYENGVHPLTRNTRIEPEQNRQTSAVLSEKNLELPVIVPKALVPLREPIVQQSSGTVVQAIVDKRDARKWHFGIHAMAGASGSGEGLSFLDNQKSMADPSATPPRPPLVNYYSEPSPVVNGPSFSAGFSARKRIGNRLDFITGIQYEYYSTRHEVGIRINQRSSNAGLSSGLNQYYINYGATLQQYLNQYHFISLPLAIAVQPFGSLPVEIQGGISVKQLVKTNALKYDSNIEGYYFDRSAFHNTQFYAGASISYAFLDHSLLAGPCFEYGLTSPQKQDDGHRLFAYGLKLQYIFRKK